MSLYRSVLEVLYKDFQLLEMNALRAILESTGRTDREEAKIIGEAKRLSVSRSWLGAISQWCSDNAGASSAPESFLPELNKEIKAILTPPAVKVESEDSDEENEGTSDAAVA